MPLSLQPTVDDLIARADVQEIEKQSNIFANAAVKMGMDPDFRKEAEEYADAAKRLHDWMEENVPQ